MSDTIIQVNEVSKQYRLGQVGTGSLSHDINRWWYRIRGKEDPYLKVGEENDRTIRGESKYVWALKDVSFDVKKGEVIGIIGKNGAGKSTLLKILSRTTIPTLGNIKIKGRVASLLEVGTGFHPELSGKENIFLNGAILGMTKRDIIRKFDEIVDFAGVERYIDTPVKRYSSGMYVRLAFAVAAHLEPEILVVDEVLAVGDAEFQKKCLGKMKDVSGKEGRTVLFVSHNMTAVTSLCKSCVYLIHGKVWKYGASKDLVDEYLTIESKLNGIVKINTYIGDENVMLRGARLVNEKLQQVDSIYTYQSIGVEITFEVLSDKFYPIPNIHLSTSKGDLLFVSAASKDLGRPQKGIYKSVVWIPGNLLNENKYIVGVALSTMSPEIVHLNIREALIFEVLEDITLRKNDLGGSMPGLIRPELQWETSKLYNLS